MLPDLIDAKFNAFFAQQREHSRSGGKDVLAITILGGTLGYWLSKAVSGLVISAFFAWQIRSISYRIEANRIRNDLDNLTLEHPEKVKEAVARAKIAANVERIVMRKWFK
jgi:hypothetical protein